MVGLGPGPWRSREFRWFFTGRTVSLAGSAMTPVALSFAVLEATRSSGALAAVLAANSVTLVALLLVGGALGDRWPRRRLLVITNLAAAGTQAAVAGLLIGGLAPLWALIVLEAGNGAAAALSMPALRGVVPELVDPQALQRANSLLATSRNATKVLGPTVAGLAVVGVGGGWAIALDAASYALAALCLLRVNLAAPAPTCSGLWVGLREGWVEFRTRSWVLAVVLAFAGVNLVVGGVWLVLGPSIAAMTVGPAGWGATLSARAVGLLLAGLVMYRLRTTHPLRWAQVGGALMAVPMVALGLGLSVGWLVGGGFVAGAGMAVTGVTWETALQQHVPAHALSRVASYDNFGSFATVPLGQLAVVPLAAALGQPTTALAGAALLAMCALGGLAVPAVRRLGQAPQQVPAG